MASPQSENRAAWKNLYSKELPALAKAKDTAQAHWPVVLDHCFGRIILDHVVGEAKTPWNQKLKGPAIKHMTDEQVDACIDLGKRIASGNVDLVELDEQSLAVRGKKSKHFSSVKSTAGTKRKRRDAEDGSSSGAKATNKQSRGSEDDPSVLDNNPSEDEEAREEQEQSSSDASLDGDADAQSSEQVESAQPKKRGRKDASLEELRQLVKTSDLIPMRKQILLALLQVPRGKFTTYGAISDFLKSSPRAIGNGMRNNPFAPEVPCHRVLAADGKIGGYCGQWGEGKLIDEKRKILREEGIKFDGKGKVVGTPWRGFRPE